MRCHLLILYLILYLPSLEQLILTPNLSIFTLWKFSWWRCWIFYIFITQTGGLSLICCWSDYHIFIYLYPSGYHWLGRKKGTDQERKELKKENTCFIPFSCWIMKFSSGSHHILTSNTWLSSLACRIVVLCLSFKLYNSWYSWTPSLEEWNWYLWNKQNNYYLWFLSLANSLLWYMVLTLWSLTSLPYCTGYPFYFHPPLFSYFGMTVLMLNSCLTSSLLDMHLRYVGLPRNFSWWNNQTYCEPFSTWWTQSPSYLLCNPTYLFSILVTLSESFRLGPTSQGFPRHEKGPWMGRDQLLCFRRGFSCCLLLDF